MLRLNRATGITRSAVVLSASVLAACLMAGCRSGQQSSATASSVSPDTWAVVDGKTITKNDVEKAFRQAADPAQQLSREEALDARLNILDELITEEILLARAGRQNLTVADADVDAAYAQMKQNMSDADFQQQLTSRNVTTADVREGIRRRLLAQKVIDTEVGARITVTDQQVTDFFNANRQQFNMPEDAYHLAQIIVTPVRDAQLTNRTGDDATTVEAARAKVAMLMDRLSKGTPFGDLARDYSEDPESAPRGGDLGLVPVSSIRQAPQALRDAVLQAGPGRARVVNQNGAVMIVFVVSKEAAGQRDLSTPGVRQQISEELRGRKEELLRTAYLTAARTDADVVNYLARTVVQSQGASPVPGQ